MGQTKLSADVLLREGGRNTIAALRCLMKRSLKILLYIGSGFLLMVLLVEFTFYIENVRVRRRGEELLSAIRHLQVGESTLSTTETLRTQFGAQKLVVSRTSGLPPEQRYQILLSNYLLNNLRLRFPNLWAFGLRPAAVELELRYEDQKLTELIFMVRTPVITDSGGPLELVASMAVVASQEAEAPTKSGLLYRIQPSSLMAKARELRIGEVLTQSAPQEEREAAFDFDLHCVSSFSGCYAFCQTLPSDWREALRRYENKEISQPKEVLENSGCATH
jgi:hypothetical protein